MGSLTPGTIYVYEKADGVTYAREFGQAPEERKAIGWDYPNNQPSFKDSTFCDDSGRKSWMREREQEVLWKNIRSAAISNPALQKALDHAIMIYRLSKDNPL